MFSTVIVVPLATDRFVPSVTAVQRRAVERGRRQHPPFAPVTVLPTTVLDSRIDLVVSLSSASVLAVLVRGPGQHHRRAAGGESTPSCAVVNVPQGLNTPDATWIVLPLLSHAPPSVSVRRWPSASRYWSTPRCASHRHRAATTPALINPWLTNPARHSPSPPPRHHCRSDS